MIEKNIEKIRSAISRIKLRAEQNNKAELSFLISELEKASRKEKSKFYLEYFTDMNLALKLVDLVDKSDFDKNVIINVISLLGNMIRRYGLIPSDELFDFFFQLKDVSKINYYVSLFITAFPQFEKNEQRWDYLISMVKIPPKTKSERNFYLEIKRIITAGEEIPPVYKNKIIYQFELFLKQDINEIYRNEYKEMIVNLQ